MKFIDENIERYAISKSTIPSVHCQNLANYTRENEPMSMMLVGEMEGSFLGFLIRSTGAKRVLEVGTYTGYSALVMAENLPEDGEVHTCDVEEKDFTSMYWAKSPAAKKIHLHLGKALETIPQIEGEFDLAFIDADKTNYKNYLEMILPRLSKRGVIAIDNVLWSGSVLKPDSELGGDENASTRAIKEVNDFVAEHPDLYGTMLPIRDGIFLITKN